MAKKLVQFATWNDEPDAQYWETFDTLEDAVSGHEDGVEVFRAAYSSLGKWKRSAVLARVKKKKPRKKR